MYTVLEGSFLKENVVRFIPSSDLERRGLSEVHSVKLSKQLPVH
jgi:hypothetical protein